MNEPQDLPLAYDNADCDLEAMLEALIFVSNEPLTIERMVDMLLLSDISCDSRSVRSTLNSLMTKWGAEDRVIGRGMTLEKVSGGYVFVTAIRQASLVRVGLQKKPMELTKSQMEVLSIVAYRQPITRVDIDDIRGVDSSTALKRLMQLKLLKILGKSEGLGRPLLYGTTKYFLEFFSLNSLNDLPTLKQFESLGQGDEVEAVDLNSERVSIKDLFQSQKNNAMNSSEVQRLSDEALQSLDEALVRIDGVEKISVE